MKVISSRLMIFKLGNSKLSIHSLTHSDKYILTIQNVDSENLAILEKLDNEYQTGKDGEGDIGQYVIIDDVEVEDLQKLAKQLQVAFPLKEKK